MQRSLTHLWLTFLSHMLPFLVLQFLLSSVCSSMWESQLSNLTCRGVYFLHGKGLALASFVMSFIVLFVAFDYISLNAGCLSGGAYKMGLDSVAPILKKDDEDEFLLTLKESIYQWVFCLIPASCIMMGEVLYTLVSEGFFSMCYQFTLLHSWQWGSQLYSISLFDKKVLGAFLGKFKGETLILGVWFGEWLSVFPFQDVYGSVFKGCLEVNEFEGFMVMGNSNWLVTSSKDVMHSVGCSELGLKLDAIPGSYNSQLLSIDGECGEVIFNVLCAEFCGVGHPFMSYSMVSCNELSSNLLF